MDLIKDRDLSKLISAIPEPLTDEQSAAARLIILRLTRGAMAERLNITLLASFVADSHYRAILKETIKKIETLDVTKEKL